MSINNQQAASSSTVNQGFTGNQYIDGILWGGESLPSNTITYSFFNSDSTNWSQTGIDVMEQALETWESVANIKFVRVANNNSNSTFRFHLVDNDYFATDGVVLGSFVPPGEKKQGMGLFNVEMLGQENFSLNPGGTGFATLVHEIGHGLGLAHPHDIGGGSSIYSGVTSLNKQDTGTYGLNQGVWTAMSYNQGFNNAGVTASPMAFDIAAVQHLYGANPNYASGNNVYQLPTSDTYTAIWDTGGIDTISAYSSTADVKIDLRDAPLTGANAGGYISSMANIDGGFTIANDVEIENATGGWGEDILIANEKNNSLQGRSGNDTLIGAMGQDTLIGGYGNDILVGSDPSLSNSGLNEYDRLTGGLGADLFVLGDKNSTYYQGKGYATITYFDQSDRIIVSGSASDYSLQKDTSNGSTDIYYKNDVIGYVENTTNIFISEDFTFV